MAKRLEGYERSARGNRNVYPWDGWQDGEWYEVDPQREFSSSINAFRKAAYYEAAQRDLKAETLVIGDRVRFRFTPQEEASQ